MTAVEKVYMLAPKQETPTAVTSFFIPEYICFEAKRLLPLDREFPELNAMIDIKSTTMTTRTCAEPYGYTDPPEFRAC
jgi:hypothetical protein